MKMAWRRGTHRSMTLSPPATPPKREATMPCSSTKTKPEIGPTAKRWHGISSTKTPMPGAISPIADRVPSPESTNPNSPTKNSSPFPIITTSGNSFDWHPVRRFNNWTIAPKRCVRRAGSSSRTTTGPIPWNNTTKTNFPRIASTPHTSTKYYDMDTDSNRKTTSPPPTSSMGRKSRGRSDPFFMKSIPFPGITYRRIVRNTWITNSNDNSFRIGITTFRGLCSRWWLDRLGRCCKCFGCIGRGSLGRGGSGRKGINPLARRRILRLKS
mmetsp:Transcript_20792/g.41897  ORF Transcript_20792/g.41897 Transcript_20792/m.41897 type:complete len:269 (-) Transcript_20792:157-963(-)